MVDTDYNTVCQWQQPHSNYHRWDKEFAIRGNNKLCDLCYPDGDIPDCVSHVLRSCTAGGGRKRLLHLAEADAPDGWEAKSEEQYKRDTGASALGTSQSTLAWDLADPDVTEISDLEDVDT